ncbi:uncharacterized protein LOC125649923 [Ostrea edulis]|uniref:uncharacterized protein LOC125649923 n=1 Tax=Ostrea edulis TaxID=37623 RepID=UPI0024AF0996|nr:uncharacterized protein LOC125649923 [Ostrea edulis]
MLTTQEKLTTIALFFLIIGFLFTTVAFSTTGWLEILHKGRKFHIGLWRVCERRCYNLDGIVLNWWGYVQTTGCVGLVGTLCATILTAVCIYVERFQWNNKLLRFAAIVTILTWIMEVSGCVTFVVSWIRTSPDYGANDDLFYLGLPTLTTDRTDLSYSLVFAILGAQLTLVGGIMLFHVLQKIEECSKETIRKGSGSTSFTPEIRAS